METFFKRLKFWWMEEKIATLEKSLCQGIANKRRNIEVYCKQAEKYKD